MRCWAPWPEADSRGAGWPDDRHDDTLLRRGRGRRADRLAPALPGAPHPVQDRRLQPRARPGEPDRRRSPRRPNHHPDVDLRYPHVNVTLFSHDVFGVTSRDVDLARAISAAAAELGVEADPHGDRRRRDRARHLPTIGRSSRSGAPCSAWRTARRTTRSCATRPARSPPCGSSRPTPHDEPRQRFHLDIRVPPEVAEDRIAAALDAGGVLVSDEQAPRVHGARGRPGQQGRASPPAWAATERDVPGCGTGVPDAGTPDRLA